MAATRANGRTQRFVELNRAHVAEVARHELIPPPTRDCYSWNVGEEMRKRGSLHLSVAALFKPNAHVAE